MTHYPSLQVPGFAMDVRHWRTVAEFRAHLAAHHPQIADWATGVVIHHTVKPLPSDWRGADSMLALARYYRSIGWPTGPHLFVASGTLDPGIDGIWQLTPLNRKGTHAQQANAFAWGIEHVGNFDRAPMPPDVVALGAGAAAALLDWRGLLASRATVMPHAQFSPKSCPGSAVAMTAYVRAVRALQAPIVAAPEQAPASSYSPVSPILSPPGLERPALEHALQRRCAASPYGDLAIGAIARHLWQTATTLGVDPVVVAAQMCHETANLGSSWSLPPHHNPAGIGVTGQPGIGTTFPSLARGVDAQIGRLLAYATMPHERSPMQQHAVDQALDWRALPAACHGSAPTLHRLGRVHNAAPGCGWASPGDRYGESIAAVANRLMELAR